MSCNAMTALSTGSTCLRLKKKTLCYFLNTIKHSGLHTLKGANIQHVLSGDGIHSLYFIRAFQQERPSWELFVN